MFSLSDITDIAAFTEQANLHHPTIKFTTETFDTETVFLDTVVYKGTRFKEKSILDATTHFKQTETFLHTHKKDLSKEKPWEFYEKTPQKQPLRKIIQISGETLDGRKLPTNFDRKPTITNKIHIRDTILTLSVYYNGNEKVKSYTRPTIPSLNF